ncbi:MAG: exodeoxyribonuclease V subunit gamma [Burkholderiaceae bacterium]|nr:exodeoxyribonuclease V subunit gamma [Burkholderiaceae bacterium]
MTGEHRPGLLVLHGNRTEQLAEAIFEWVGANPLRPLEEETFLVQSNGVAEWLKMSLAAHCGIAAAVRVELPGRFLWRAYRQVLGREAVPATSPLDKQPLTWILMQLLPRLVSQPHFEPLAGFLRRGDMGRRLQLAERLADLYDQYQVYRSDWLAAWADGDDVLIAGDGSTREDIPPDQRWQPALWRELLASLPEASRASIRPILHRRFLAALDAGVRPRSPVPRRIVLFGATHVPMQALEALAALSRRAQVLLAIPNPCRFHWADVIQGRELLRMQRRRHPLRHGRDLAAVSLEEMHAHAHPLLAAWGRQGRDLVRQLDAFDDALAACERFAVAKVDLFSEGPGETLLEQVQARIRDLVPLVEHPALANRPIEPADRSIVFHVAHGVQREVEILHDQLLELLAHPPRDRPLDPRDVVVMVPDIALFAPAIRSVFGQYDPADPRHIPFDVADLEERGNNPLLGAVEWLLRLPVQRCTLSEVRDLLDVPAVAARFDLVADDMPRLARWLAGAGVRWGLDQAQRDQLGLGAGGEQNTWVFGLRRMLLGYASGVEYLGIEPYEEVGGLDASIAGSLAAVVDALADWWTAASEPATPARWAARMRALIEAFVAPTDERERMTVAALLDALRGWLDACASAGFDEPVSLAVAREAWFAGIDEPGVNKRFHAGGVTFCTLLPMRSIPFEVVCLLGMNDGDYPRSSRRSDFDLTALPRQHRPGDRSRRDDDRQLMLEAVLSARRVLYVSWTGRSARENVTQPASVLVAQLRDYLAAGWGDAVVAQRTTEHPLQPFSRRYFEEPESGASPASADAPPAGGRLFTYAREWRAAHHEEAPSSERSEAIAFRPDPAVPLTIDSLSSFFRSPVRSFFRDRLDVVFRDEEESAEDEESYELSGLAEYGLLEEVLRQVLLEAPANGSGSAHPAVLRSLVEAQVARQRRAGRLPVGELGARAEQALVDDLVPMLDGWAEAASRYPEVVAAERLRFEVDDLVLEDWFGGVRAPAVGVASGEPPAWLELRPSRLCGRNGTVSADKLIGAWVKAVVAAACGFRVRGVIVGRDAVFTVDPLARDPAIETLRMLMRSWREGMARPLPIARRTALAHVSGVANLQPIFEGQEGSRGEVTQDACLARMFPDLESLTEDGRFHDLADRLYGPLRAWAQQLTRETHGERASRIGQRAAGQGTP